ncbi:MAG: hypothetical protein HFP77_00815 [Methylococcales symbiont of Iophon sp. n. MRB-2018]|nr:MAG: hypothetical protein HFP77_00815 [Methylococcales symbiont of Iophon sp. n. MRB-2018]KAF3980120.1 MAG: hypothetical protein HFP76_03770 [Methylococcales symbiont of Iophon sp. n. MRB-2018]
MGFFYFIDDSFTKNKNFYTAEIQKLSTDYGLVLHLSYGDNLFNELNKIEIWDEILNHLKAWKNNIPDLPEINFDKNPQASFEEIKHLKPLVYRKLLSNPDLDGLLCVLFPEKLTLNLLNEYFQQMHQNNEGTIYKTLNELCVATISRITNHSSRSLTRRLNSGVICNQSEKYYEEQISKPSISVYVVGFQPSR